MTSKAYSENYKLIQWNIKPSMPARMEQIEGTKAFTVMPDIVPFVSPINGQLIGSRKHLRDHERAYEVRQCGDLRGDVNNFNNYRNKPQQVNERALESAYRKTLEQKGLV